MYITMLFVKTLIISVSFVQMFFFQKQPSRGIVIKGALEICIKSTGEHPCQSVISIKLVRNFIKITLQHGCSPVNLLHIF